MPRVKAWISAIASEYPEPVLPILGDTNAFSHHTLADARLEAGGRAQSPCSPKATRGGPAKQTVQIPDGTVELDQQVHVTRCGGLIAAIEPNRASDLTPYWLANRHAAWIKRGSLDRASCPNCTRLWQKEKWLQATAHRKNFRFDASCHTCTAPTVRRRCWCAAGREVWYALPTAKYICMATILRLCSGQALNSASLATNASADRCRTADALLSYGSTRRGGSGVTFYQPRRDGAWPTCVVMIVSARR